MPITPQRLLLLGAALVFALGAAPASAQWAWRDASGKMVFSDQAPPKSVPERDVVRRPEAPSGPRYDAAAAPQAEAGSESKGGESKPAAEAPKSPAKAAAPKTIVEREIESRRRQQQLAEAQKKADDEEKRKAQLAENCERLRSYQRALADGLRLARVNAAGEREVLDDAARAAETERTRAQIEQYCR